MCDLPWTEKYRPKNLDEIIGHDSLVKFIRLAIVKKMMPNMIFYGPAGTGKTSLAYAIRNEMLGKHITEGLYTGGIYYEINASCDRGVDVVREQISSFCSIYSAGFKLIFLDEFDAMTNEAQSALKRVIEVNNDVCFIMACNNITKVLPELQSRCILSNVGGPRKDDIIKRIVNICEIEKVNIDLSALKCLIKYFDDMRCIISHLQMLKVLHEDKVITNSDIYELLAIPSDEAIIEMYIILISKAGTKYKHICDILYEHNYNFGYLLEELIEYTFVNNIELVKPLIEIFKNYRLGVDNKVLIIQLSLI